HYLIISRNRSTARSRESNKIECLTFFIATTIVWFGLGNSSFESAISGTKNEVSDALCDPSLPCGSRSEVLDGGRGRIRHDQHARCARPARQGRPLRAGCAAGRYPKRPHPARQSRWHGDRRSLCRDQGAAIGLPCRELRDQGGSD